MNFNYNRKSRTWEALILFILFTIRNFMTKIVDKTHKKRQKENIVDKINKIFKNSQGPIVRD